MKLASILSGVIVIASGYTATASAAEPTLPSILNTIEATSWSNVGFGSLISESWNKAGTTLNFGLASENTAWNNFQSFIYFDTTSSLGNLVFEGSDTSGATASTVLDGAITALKFNSNSGNSQQTSNGTLGELQVWKSLSGKYAFAYEDYKPGDLDFNDMVISLNISAVSEANTLAMMLAGLGLIGFMSNRRKS